MTVSPRSRVLTLVPVALCALVILAVLVGLGLWQLDRLGWKEDLIAKVHARVDQPAMSLPPEGEWPKVSFENDEYRRVQVEGRFRHDLETQVYALIDAEPNGQGGPGYWIVTPLALPDGAYVLINRGYVPTDRRDPATRSEGQEEGQVTITGLLRMPEQPSSFSPPNEPEKESWFVREPDAIASARGLVRVAPFLIDADASANPGGLPRGGLTRIAFPNRHMEYALTWFGLAASLLGVFIAYVWTRLRRR